MPWQTDGDGGTLSGTVKITYFDTAMALIEIGSLRILTDPVLDPAGTSFQYGPIQLNKTSAATVGTLGRVDAVLLSHDQHGDNLDNAGRRYLGDVPLEITTPLAAGRLEGVSARGLQPWRTHVIRGREEDELRVTAMPAQHGPDGTQDATGPVTGFLIEHDSLSATVYFSGDTILFGGTEEIARRCAPVGLALLNIGRVQLPPLGDAMLSLSAEDAAGFARDLRARWVVPLHFEGWKHFTQGRAEAAAVFDRLAVASKVRWLAAGMTGSFDI